MDVYIDSVKEGAATGQSVPVYSPEQVLASLAAETVKGSGGKAYRLDSFVTMQKSNALSSIQERAGEPVSVVQAQITSSDMSKVSKDVEKTLKDIHLPAGVSYSLGGITQQVTQMIIEIAIAVAVSILLVLLITSMVFKGWKAPIAVLLSIPLALSGIVISLYAIHGQWNLAAFIGVLMLTGIVVTNGIVLIDKIERNQKEGMELRDGLCRAACPEFVQSL